MPNEETLRDPEYIAAQKRKAARAKEQDRLAKQRAHEQGGDIARIVFLGLGITGLAAIYTGAVLANNKLHHDHQSPRPAPLEKPGDHQGSASMLSQEHLNKFAAEHGILLNQK
jgi:hypothetical protein